MPPRSAEPGAERDPGDAAPGLGQRAGEEERDGSPDAQASATRGGTGFWSVVQSVGAAMIGVQSRRNRERDFTRGKPLHFVIGGLVGTAIFILVVWLLVQYVLATS